jgi:hypothetical protein
MKKKLRSIFWIHFVWIEFFWRGDKNNKWQNMPSLTCRNLMNSKTTFPKTRVKGGGDLKCGFFFVIFFLSDWNFSHGTNAYLVTKKTFWSGKPKMTKKLIFKFQKSCKSPFFQHYTTFANVVWSNEKCEILVYLKLKKKVSSNGQITTVLTLHGVLQCLKNGLVTFTKLFTKTESILYNICL